MKILPLVRCRDKSIKNKIPDCKFAIDPISIGVLTSKDMMHLGYITCSDKGDHYLCNSDRKCSKYKMKKNLKLK